MKILICCATPGELKTVKEAIKNLNLKTSLPLTYLNTWIGNHATIFHLTKFLTEHADEKYFIVNIGVCGIIPAQPLQHVPTTQPVPTTPTLPPLIQASTITHLNLEKETVVPIFLQVAPLGKLIASEVIVDDSTMIKKWEDETLFVDMESRWIEFVAQQFQLPRLILKVPVDVVGEETQHFNREKALEKLKNQIDYLALVDKLLVLQKVC